MGGNQNNDMTGGSADPMGSTAPIAGGTPTSSPAMASTGAPAMTTPTPMNADSGMGMQPSAMGGGDDMPKPGADLPGAGDAAAEPAAPVASEMPGTDTDTSGGNTAGGM